MEGILVNCAFIFGCLPVRYLLGHDNFLVKGRLVFLGVDNCTATTSCKVLGSIGLACQHLLVNLKLFNCKLIILQSSLLCWSSLRLMFSSEGLRIQLNKLFRSLLDLQGI